jgi:ERCC4-type nuclease
VTDGLVPIVVDTAEVPSGVPEALRRLGAEVFVARLPAGDYRVGGGALVERKTVFDLHKTLVDGRLFRQLGDLRTSCEAPFLLVEGAWHDAGPLGRTAVRGALLTVLELGVPVLRSEGRADSALWLHRLAVRQQRAKATSARPTYAQGPKARPDHAPEAVLAAVRTLSTHSARALLRHFGSVQNVMSASVEELQQVPGIGPVRAQRLRRAFMRPHFAYRSRRSRE